MANPILRTILQKRSCAIMLITIGLLSCNQAPQRTMPLESEPFVPAAPPPPPPDAFLGKISPTVLNKLNHMPVMAPAYVPSGFALAEYRFEGAESYGLIYRNPENLCFAIEYRLQPPLAENSASLKAQSFDSPIFGPERKLYYSTLDSQTSNKANQPSQLFSEWLSKDSGAYRLIGSTIIGQNYPAQTACQNVSLVEASKVITSIAALTASPTD